MTAPAVVLRSPAAPEQPRPARWLSAGLISLGLYLALTVASYYPQSLRPRDTIAYVGDSLESVYLVAWNVHQFFRAPARLFEANVLHPSRNALAFTDHRLLPSLAVAPVLWLSGNPVLAYNVAVALAGLLAAFGARHLARVLGASPLGAWAAGALYAFHTYQVNEAPRLNIISHGFIPFALAALLRYLGTGKARQAWAVAGLLLLQGLSSNYHLLYGMLVLSLVVAGALAARPRWAARRLPLLALTMAAAGLLFLPLAIPYFRAARVHGYVRELPAGVDLVHYFSTAPTNLLYGSLGGEVRLQQRGPHFIGFVALGLAALALAWRPREEQRHERSSLVRPQIWVPAAVAMALLLITLSLGRDLVAFGHRLGPGPYRLLYDFVPGFGLVRIPERLGLLAMLFISLLVARGLTLVQMRWRVVALLLAFALPLEHLSPLPLTTRIPVRRDVPRVYQWLADNRTGAVAEVPVRGEGLIREETLEMYFSTYHFKPVIHGYTAYPPLLSRLLRRMAAEFPSALSLQALSGVGVDTVVVHHGRPLGLDLLQQLPPSLPDRENRFARVLRESRLDLYDRLPAAVAAGRIRREASFEGPASHLFQSTADEVYRLVPTPPMSAAVFPRGRRLRDGSWRYRTKLGDPTPAVDGDMRTAWTVARPLRGDEFFEVVFDRTLPVAGLVLPLRRDSAFPTRFRVGGRDGAGRWFEVARWDDAHALQLLDALRADPRRAAIGFDLGARGLSGLSLLVEEGGTSVEGWSLPEVEVWVP